jgi:hypothetical protein
VLTTTGTTAYILSLNYRPSLLSSAVSLNRKRRHPGATLSVLQEDRASSDLLPTRNDTEVFQSYYSNLQRVKCDKRASKQALLRPAQSLVYFLREKTRSSYYSPDDLDALSQAAIQAIRVASSVNEYRLIIQLVEELGICSNGQVNNRIVGEAIRGLSETSVSINKIKRVWALVDFESVTAQEVNAMIETYMGRNKVEAAIKLFRDHLMRKQVDQYSLGIILKGLTKSVQDEQAISLDSYEIDNKLFKVILPSPCWQWKKAIKVLDESSDFICLNNPIISNLIRLDERCGEVFPGEHPNHALFCLEILKGFHIKLDGVTCALALRARIPWRSSLQLFRRMQQQTGDDSWYLPQPNVYAYASVMSSCARGLQYDVVLDLLKDLNQNPLVAPNTYIYNTVLQALVKGPARFSKDRVLLALDLLARMQQDDAIAPDTVSFNTILSLCSVVKLRARDWEEVEKLYSVSDAESLTTNLLDLMRKLGIPKNIASYRHALQALKTCDSSALERMLDLALSDETACRGHEATLMNAALGASSSRGYVDKSLEIIARMSPKTFPNADTFLYFIDCLGNAGKANIIPTFLLAMDNENDARYHLKSNHNITFVFDEKTELTSEHFSCAIKSCVMSRDFESSRQILKHLQEKQAAIPRSILQDTARAYAMVSIELSGGSNAASPSYQEAQLHASKASDIIMSMPCSSVSPSLAAVACRACGQAGLYCDARNLLSMIHRSLASRLKVQSMDKDIRLGSQRPNEEVVLPFLHRSLMKSCAVNGNVTAALLFCEDIQHISQQISMKIRQIQKPNESPGSILQVFNDRKDCTLSMELPEWKSLLEAAMKAGHWKVCLSTMQFIRPYLEDLHPSNATRTRDHVQKYRGISTTLIETVQCLTKRGQYAWAVRTIEDWIRWSGRRPPDAAVHETVRALCARGRGKEVLRLVETCLHPESSSDYDDAHYELSVYVSAITALSHVGINSVADELFLIAVSRKSLPFSLKKSVIGGRPCMVIDLHRMNLAIARSAVRVAFQKHMIDCSQSLSEAQRDLIIVTGRGLGSGQRLRPVLRPEVQRLLLEEFCKWCQVSCVAYADFQPSHRLSFLFSFRLDPPVNTYSIPGNMGALRVSYTDIGAWLDHQNKAKSTHMLALAAALRTLSSTERLRSLLKLTKPSESAESN